MFALFSTEPGDHLERYCIFRFNGDYVEHVPVYAPLYIDNHNTEFEPVRILIKTATGIVLTHFWHTNWEIIMNGESIPVYDFTNKHLIFPEVPRVSCKYDYMEWCNYRVQNQKILYSSYARTYGHDENFPTGHGIVPPVVERVIPNKKEIPTFVAQALIKSAKDAEEDCPISIMAFTECNKISVTNCYHCFDAASLEEWYKKKKECPVCKTDITSVVTL